MPLLFDYADNSLAIGLVDMSNGMKEGTEIRAGISQPHHVLEVVTTFQRSSDQGVKVSIQSKG